LKKRGINCWIHPIDYTAGDRTWKEIKEERNRADKMIIVCSSASLIRDGFLKEIEDQIDENPDKIIPISLDDLWKEDGFKVMRGNQDLKPFIKDRNYVDFNKSLNYEKALEKLITALKRK